VARTIHSLPRLVETPKDQQRFHLADAFVIAAPLQRQQRQLLENGAGEICRRLAVACKQKQLAALMPG
jgi:hypothetical protein